MAPIPQIPPPLQIPLFEQNFCWALEETIGVIVQIAVRVIFITGSILMAASTIPLQFHAVVLPVVAFGTTALAAFFFPERRLVASSYSEPMAPLIYPVRERPVEVVVPPDAPRGLINMSNNCAFNSLVQFLEADPQVAAWLRNPIPPNMDLEAFVNFLAGYNAPAELVDAFREYAGQNAALPIQEAFTAFLTQNNLPAYQRIRKIYTDLNTIQEPFNQFFAAWDLAVQENLPVADAANSQRLREALSLVTAWIDPSPHIQVDAAEVMRYILDLLPDEKKMQIETTPHLHSTAVPPAPIVERTTVLTLELRAPTFDRMFENYCNNTVDIEPRRAMGRDGIERNYPVERNTVRFLEAPPALRFQIKRFGGMAGPISWLTRVLPSWFPYLGWRGVKRDDPIEFPEEKEITLANGEVRRYRLASFAIHRGSFSGGHYTSGRNVNGQKYIVNDRSVTPADRATWESQLRQAYLLCYLRV